MCRISKTQLLRPVNHRCVLGSRAGCRPVGSATVLSLNRCDSRHVGCVFLYIGFLKLVNSE
jgi:hypothetical protein